MKKLDILITGVGGQGVILSSDIIGEIAITAGYDAKKTDTIGMAQRGGSVISHVRLASRVYSPLIKEGEVNLLIALEKLEAARWSHYLHPEGTVIINNLAIPPLSVAVGSERYPSDEEIVRILRRHTERVYLVEGTSRAKELGSIRTLNMFMLGCASPFIPFKIQSWKDGISQHLPSRVLKINLTAFEQGRKEMKNANI
ncbi:MAG: indolepyruvate oxidoreductase subunit beta [Dehalococcoidales bacterium]|nr:indolepyruvate oxidoreductase subunit beta [Dehalococcoidales bacterium]